MPEGCTITTIEKVPQRINKALENFKYAEKEDSQAASAESRAAEGRLAYNEKTGDGRFFECSEAFTFERALQDAERRLQHQHSP